MLLTEGFFLKFSVRNKFSEPIIALLKRVDLLMIQMTKNEMFSHCGVFPNLADEDLLFVFHPVLNASAFASFLKVQAMCVFANLADENSLIILHPKLECFCIILCEILFH